jgi:HEAT repeat protein
MLHRQVRVALTLLAFAAATQPAWAHGGRYRGPSGDVDHTRWQIGDPPPRDGVERWSTGPFLRFSISFESWIFWWHYNKDEFCAEVSGTAAPNAALDAATEATIVSVLKRYARKSSEAPDLRAAAVLALAKLGRREEAPLFLELARNDSKWWRHGKVVERSAVLALGVLQDRSPHILEFLRERALDKASDSKSRCYAMISLGMLGEREGPVHRNRETLEVLKKVVLSRENYEEVPSAALFAMGLLGDAAAAPDLVRWMEEGKAGEIAFGSVTHSVTAAALGAIGVAGWSGPNSTEVVDALQRQLKGGNRVLGYSAVIALGRIAIASGATTRAECVATLAETAAGGTKSQDPQTAHFALIALGRIAGVHESSRDAAVAALRRAFESPVVETSSFAALGLALAFRHGEPPGKITVAEALRKRLVAGDLERCGAPVVALGLLRDAASVPALTLIARENTDDRLRGMAAVALGFIGDDASRATIRGILEERRYLIKAEAALAAGRLRDREAVDLLMQRLRNVKSSRVVLGEIAVALGRIGDPRVVPELLEVIGAEEDEYQDLTRAMALVALSEIARGGRPTVLDSLSKDVNYRANFNAMDELLFIL